MSINDSMDQIIAIAQSVKAQNGGGDAQPAGGSGSVTGTLVKGQQPPIGFDAAGGTFAFVAAPGTFQIVTAYDPGHGPRPSNDGSIWISDTPGGAPLIGPNDFGNGDSYGDITAMALTPGDTYYVTVKRSVGGGWIIQYV